MDGYNRSFQSTDFLFNNLINRIINNKNSKIIILVLRIAARHWHWRFENVPLGVAFFLIIFSIFYQKKKRKDEPR
jgi:hypothetical protein